MIMIFIALSFLLSLSLPFTTLNSLVVGSTSSVASIGNTIFPSADSNNTIVGFSMLEQGFSLADNLTSCTFSGLLSVPGNIALTGGTLYLRDDLILSGTAAVTQAGKIYGNGYAFELPQCSQDYFIPTLPPNKLGLILVDDESMFATVRSISWSFDDQYIAAGSLRTTSNTELKVYYFDGTVLTTTASIELDQNVISLAWHPTLRYFAAGRASSSGAELYVYRHNISNGTIASTASVEYGSLSTQAVAWHPNGNFLMVGRTGGTSEIVAYSFNTTTGVLTSVATADLSPNRDINANALSFSPTGAQFVVGTTRNTSSGGEELIVYKFNGSAIILSATINTDIAIQGVAWSPISNYIAVGFKDSTTTRIRIYQYDPLGETLTLVPSGSVSENQQVTNLVWDKTGTYLSVGIDNGISSRLDVYYFDSTAVTLTRVQSLPSTTAVFISEWDHGNKYITWGDRNKEINVAKRAEYDLLINNASLILNANTFLKASCFFRGTCKVDGQGKKLVLDEDNGLLFKRGSKTTFENIDIYNIRNKQFLCQGDDCEITLRNCTLHLSDNFTFSQGSILFDQECILSGTSRFIFSPSHSSTINDNSSLVLSSGMTFSYAPTKPRRSLLYFNNQETSVLFCQDGSTLHSTVTGLSITQGSIVLDGKVTFSSEGRNSGEALKIAPAVNIFNLSNAVLDLYGRITYE